MNRTTTFLVIAAALGLVALVVKLPAQTVVVKVAEPVKVALPSPEPVVVVRPAEAPKSTPGSLTLSGKLSHPYVTPGTSDVFLSLDVTGVDVPGAKRAPVNLSLVIDRSGSMNGEKIAHARQAALALLEQLDEHDRLAVVHYGNDVTVFPGTFVTDDNKRRLRSFISRIQDEGGTNIGDGLAAGKAQLDKGRTDFKVNRLILLSDGQPTVGITSATGLARLVTKFHADGTTITSIGVGLDFNEDLMQRLAEVGGGSYANIQNTTALASIFERDLKQAGATVARDVTLSMTLPDGVRFGEVLGRPATSFGNTITVPLPDFSAGQVEKLVVRVSVAAPSVANQAISEGNDGRAAAAEPSHVIDVAGIKLAYHDVLADGAADANLKLAALVTPDVKLAQARRDKDAVVAATRAQTAVNYRRAAQWLEKGDAKMATQQLQANEALLDDAQAIGGADLEADRAQNKQFFGLTTAPAAAQPAQRSMGTKAMKVQSFKSSGYGASVY
jgi:Ca-activated chloride channel family protein